MPGALKYFFDGNCYPRPEATVRPGALHAAEAAG
jgi:hypothetical protein